MIRYLIAAAAALCSTAASATNPVTLQFGDPPTAWVTTSDVDVRSVFGRATVERRIEIAAQQVCAASEDSSAPVASKSQFNNCYRAAITGGVAQLERVAGKQ
jgi:UrcA family protein